MISGITAWRRSKKLPMIVEVQSGSLNINPYGYPVEVDEGDGYYEFTGGYLSIATNKLIKIRSMGGSTIFAGGNALLGLVQWGDLFNQVFLQGSPNLSYVPDTLAPHISDIYAMFAGCTGFNYDLSGWDVSKFNNLEGLFANCSSFNQDIGGWDVSNVLSFYQMFMAASVFNQDISEWNTSNATNMDNMLSGALAFNQDLTGWCVSNITSRPSNFSEMPTANEPVWGTCPA